MKQNKQTRRSVKRNPQQARACDNSHKKIAAVHYGPEQKAYSLVEEGKVSASLRKESINDARNF